MPGRNNQPGLLGYGNELHRGDEATQWMLPPHQGLKSRNGAGAKVDNRLVMQPKFVALQSPPQVRFHLQATDGAPAHAGVEDLEAGSARPFGAVQGRIGVAHQVLRAIIAVGAPGDPDAGSDKYFVPIQHERRAHRRADALGDRHGIAVLPDLLQQHRELIAGQARDAAIFLQPRDGVRGAQPVPQPSRKSLQQQVPSQVSQAVVDILKAVHTQQQDRKLARGVPNSLPRPQGREPPASSRMCACLRLTVALASSAPSSNTTSLRRTTRWSASVNSGMRPMLVRTLSSLYSGLAVFPLTTITRPMVAGAGGAAAFAGFAEYSISKARSPASAVRTSTEKSRGSSHWLPAIASRGSASRRSPNAACRMVRRSASAATSVTTTRANGKTRRPRATICTLPSISARMARWSSSSSPESAGPNMRSAKRWNPRSMVFSISENRLMAELAPF